MESNTLLNILQLSDSSLPIGKFAHSAGFEGVLHYSNNFKKADICQYLESVILDSVSTLDAVATVHAHRMCSINNMDAVREIDHYLTCMKVTEGARHFSLSTGANLINVGVALTDCDKLKKYSTYITEENTLGNAAVIMAILASNLNIDERNAVLLVGRDTVVTVLSAAIRLGVITAKESQALLKYMQPVLCRSYDIASNMNIDEMTESTIEYSIYVMKQKEIEMKSFLT